MGWIAAVLIVVAAWRIAHKDRWAFLVGIAGGFLWIAKGVTTGQWDLVVLNTILCLLQLNSWIKWGKSP